MQKRNREQGWQYAKLSGHENEKLAKKLLDEDSNYSLDLLKRANINGEHIKEISIGGIHEQNVPGILGRKTKSKTDLKIHCYSGKVINISIKKSLNSQAYLIKVQKFISAFEKIFNKEIPNDVVRAMQLYWADAYDAVEIIKEYANKSDIKSYELQIKHKSLNADTLKAYNINLYNALLNWFIENSYEIVEFCFSIGMAIDNSEWSEYVWYKNMFEENDVDDILSIHSVAYGAKLVAQKETFYGDTNGGTTIQLPFGFVQWHQKSMQFHHIYQKVKKLAQEYTKAHV